MTPLRLVFMGTPDIAVPVLEALIDAGHEILCAYTQPPRPAGRGHRPQPSQARGIPVRHPASLKGAEEQAAFAALNPDAAVVIAYGLILPKAILEAPRLGCFNVHASLLPRWRGAAPIQRALMAGDAETGITIMQMDEGLDTGPMLLAGRVAVTRQTTAGSLHDALAALGARLMVEALEGVVSGTIEPQTQPQEGATYAKKLGRDEGRLDWRLDAATLDRHVRALNPWPGTWFEHEGARIRVLAAEPLPGDHGAAPGTVLEGAAVACGAGALRLRRLQRPGRAASDAEAFLRGYHLLPGTVLPVGETGA
jgi:methionyl-tRNA formyltransferase